MSLAGKWRITQKWQSDNVPSLPQIRPDADASAANVDPKGYSFTADFKADGSISVLIFVFYGVWTESGADVNFTLTDFVGQTITLYQGASDGNGGYTGTALGHTHITGATHHGSWTATQEK